MMAIDTVAAGGSSICTFDGLNYRVGPESAGANPGPACYGKGGDLTITDCNLFLGKIQPQFFPQIFAMDGKSPLNIEVVKQKFIDLQNQLDNPISIETIASGFLQIAVEKMAIALKKVSLQKGYNISEYTLCCFGGAGGQHACLIAESLGIKKYHYSSSRWSFICLWNWLSRHSHHQRKKPRKNLYPFPNKLIKPRF